MKGEIKLDTRQFTAAMAQYVNLTDKNLMEAVNGKARDVCLRAAQKQGFADRGKIKEVVTNPRWISWYCNQYFGPGNWDKDDFIRVGKLAASRRLSSIKYMRSGFVKCSKKFPKTPASIEANQTINEKHPGTSAETTQAVEKALTASLKIMWTANNASDAHNKQKILNESFNAGLSFVTADMKKYIERKQTKLAKLFSA
jgi:hypothetical protein